MNASRLDKLKSGKYAEEKKDDVKMKNEKAAILNVKNSSFRKEIGAIFRADFKLLRRRVV